MRKLAQNVLGVALTFGCATLFGCVIETQPAQPPPAATQTAAPTPANTQKQIFQNQPAPATTSFQVENGALKLPGPVLFETGKDVLKPESDSVLTVVKDYLAAKPNITKLRIEGHTDNVGNAADNETLSERRSMAVARWLTGKGVDCKRLLPVGFGDKKPIADNKTEDGRSQNRRTMFVNAELGGHAIAGLPEDGGGTVAGDPCK
jgi:OOP family OmpA-OmpF porin